MRPYKEFAGVICSDEVNNIKSNLVPYCFIMNLSKLKEKGTHWVAVYITPDSIEYFDPLGNPASIDFLKRIKSHVDSFPILVKFKENAVKWQNDSQNCGWHCINFLIKRLAGQSFKFSSGWSEVSKREGQAKKLRQKFGYL